MPLLRTRFARTGTTAAGRRVTTRRERASEITSASEVSGRPEGARDERSSTTMSKKKSKANLTKTPPRPDTRAASLAGAATHSARTVGTKDSSVKTRADVSTDDKTKRTSQRRIKALVKLVDELADEFVDFPFAAIVYV